MDKQLFNPDRIDLPRHIILIPQFWEKNYYQELKREALGCLPWLLSDILIFKDYAVIAGFLGYPHILTTLEFIKEIHEKEVYFLGTAGSLNETINRPVSLGVEEIYSSGILDHFSTEKSFSMETMDKWNLQKVKGVTVDIIQRETAGWLNEQLNRRMDFVEMELFPLRAYLGKPFYAIVVASDLLRESGIVVFPDKRLLQKEFVHSYEMIVKTISGSL